jgi:hypothetical protein
MSQLPTQIVRTYSDRVERVVSREVGPQGPQGQNGSDGEDGLPGEDGTGIPNGGTTGQVLTKQSDTNGDATWADPTGGTASLPNVLPAQVTASLLGGTVERTGLMSAAAPATGVAAEATVQSVLSSVTSLYTTLGEALTNGFIGSTLDAEP